MPVSFFSRFHAGADTSLFAEKEKVKHCFQLREPESYLCEINKRGDTVKASKLYRQTPQSTFKIIYVGTVKQFSYCGLRVSWYKKNTKLGCGCSTRPLE